jgi:hypothetical protein
MAEAQRRQCSAKSRRTADEESGDPQDYLNASVAASGRLTFRRRCAGSGYRRLWHGRSDLVLLPARAPRWLNEGEAGDEAQR